MSEDKLDINNSLFTDVKQIIEQGRGQVAQAVNVGVTATYWNVGKRVREDILENKRAEYGKQILQSLSAKLKIEYGTGFSERNLSSMVRFAETFPDIEIVSALWRQLSWTHFTIIIYIKTDLEREFYAQMCRIESWSTRGLQDKIN